MNLKGETVPGEPAKKHSQLLFARLSGTLYPTFLWFVTPFQNDAAAPI